MQGCGIVCGIQIEVSRFTYQSFLLSLQTFRFRPFRKVAKSARVNLNRYWGLLSQSSAMKPQTPASLSVPEYSVEEEQNRINELLEARNAAAIIDNARNFFYESSPEFSRHYYSGSMSSVATSCDSEDAVSTISRGSLV